MRDSGSRACSSAESTLPRTACTGGPSAAQLVQHRELDEVPACRIASAAAQPLDAGGGERAAAARQVRVGDDRERVSARREGFEPTTSASGGQRSIH